MDQYQISEGTDVYGSDGDKVGSVVAVQPNYIVVEKGFFFPTDYYIPTSAVSNYEEGKVYLNVTKDQALNEGWDVEPTGDYATTTTTGGYVADVGSTSGTVSDDVMRSDAGVADYDTTAASYDTTTATTGRVEAGETLRVPVHEEELSATKTQRQIGQVRVEKDVVAEEKALEVPVTEERVRVERRVVDRPVGADEGTFEEGTIEVPIRGEDVHLQKTARVAEEIEIGKEAVQRTEQVAGTVRREEVRVTEDADATVDSARSSYGSTIDDASGRGQGFVDSATDAVDDAKRNI